MQDTGPESGRNAGWCETWAFGSVAGTWTALGSLARLARTLERRLGSDSLGGHLDGAWGSGSVYLEKVSAFFNFAGTFFDAKPIETHLGSFHCIIWLDAGTFGSKISYRPANKLTHIVPLAVVHHKIILYQSLHISHIQWILLRLIS